MALDYAAKRKAPTPLEWSSKSSKPKAPKVWGDDFPSRERIYRGGDRYEAMKAASITRKPSEKERQAAYGHRAPKGSVAKMLIEKEKEKNGKAVKEKRKTKKVEMEIELKQAEPKNFDTVLKKYSDKTMEKLMSEGRFDDLAALCAAVAHHCPVPHRNLLMTLSELPHGKLMTQAETCLERLVESVEWSSTESKEYFRRLLFPIVDTFMEESQDAMIRRMKDRALLNESFTDLIFTQGARPGELKLTEALEWNAEGRPLDESDTVWLSRMDWVSEPGAILPYCECFVVNTSPLILKYTEEKPAVLAAMAGHPCRIDKLAPRTTFSRTLYALHCLMEPPRKVKNKKSQKEGVPDRLPMNFAPSANLKKILMGEGSEGQRRMWAFEEPHLMREMDLEDIKPSRKLNDSQRDALDNAVGNTLTLIQGPPGTGKTTTCVQILRHWALCFKPNNKNTRILATSGSNIAVDNLVEGLQKEGVKVVRIGRPESTRPELAETAVENVAAKLLGVKSLADVGQNQRRQALHRAVQEAQVVCCTAITAGGGLLKETQFPLVLIDEASQATEPATLVPICHGCKQLVLCGDHCQLPPTVKSEQKHSAELKTSLFERLALSGIRPIMLNVQYRMHPLLSAFPSMQFYDGELQDAKHKTNAKKAKAWAYEEPLVVAPVFDPETPKGTSHMNEGEAEAVVRHAIEYLRRGGTESSLGIISPYDSQVKLLRRMLKSRGVRTGLYGVEVNSVDGFQGREKEVIMISTVRSNEENATGFVRDWRRINVAMTRAKSGLLVVCNPLTLARDHISWLPWLHWSQWRGLWLNDAKLELPELRKGGHEKTRVGVNSLRRPKRRSPSRSRSPPPKWAKW